VSGAVRALSGELTLQALEPLTFTAARHARAMRVLARERFHRISIVAGGRRLDRRGFRMEPGEAVGPRSERLAFHCAPSEGPRP
jgi:hypothetical protein